MEYKALVSFSGLISMAMGEVREITDEKIVKDLLKARYIQPTKLGGNRQSREETRLSPAAGDSKPSDNKPKAAKKGGKTKK